ncbi:hypothetical protein BCR34DRAFT_670211 [Clohesyomyces aquaticus]|uniref:Uncharacterized protein n=1 Tax=Clohesyomyces aquaticus TaxID=1231657 RepID=A0A1Y2AB22_9PLEO|nr:hypothetical protein BCR34DRAFT_670211 [Clohesyomyces aquaticus]
MASFSRSFTNIFRGQSLHLPSSVRVAIFTARSQPLNACLRARFTSQSFFRQQARPSGYPSILRRTSPAFASSDPVLQAVEASKAPIVLYKAADRHAYLLGVYAFACFTLGCSLLTLKWRYELPKDLPGFVGPTYVVIAFVWIGISAYIFTAPASRCASIEVIPNRLIGRAPQMRIRSRTAPIIMPEWVQIVDIGEPMLDRKVYPVVRELLEANRARTQSLTDDLVDVHPINRFWIVVARFFNQKWTSFFLRFKFAIFRFGYVKIDVQDRRWKIDCTGYLLEDGRALDRLLAVV